MKRSDALDLEYGVFTKASARQIATSLKRSAMRSTRRKGTPYQSAMSMLNFHINRAGKGLPSDAESQVGTGKRRTAQIIRKNIAEQHIPQKEKRMPEQDTLRRANTKKQEGKAPW